MIISDQSVSICGFDYRHKMARNRELSSETCQSILVLRKKKCEKLPRNWRSRTTLCTTPFTEQGKLVLTRIERGVGSPGEQLSKRTSTLECLVCETDTSQVLEGQHPRVASSLLTLRLVLSRPGHRGFYSLFWLGQGVTRVGILCSMFLCFAFLCCLAGCGSQSEAAVYYCLWLRTILW